MDSEILCESLLVWIGTFKGITGAHQTVQDLMDGVAMAECLSKIAPTLFSQEWLSKIKQDVNYNWRLKASNLKKVLRGIELYYCEILKQDLNNISLPDVNRIAYNRNEEELGKMLQLILGCAFFCANKEDYIRVITQLESEVQEVIMTAIQELMTPTTQNDQAVAEESIEKLEQKIHELSLDKKDLESKCRDLENQIANLQEDLASVKEQLTRYDNVDIIISDPTTAYGRKFQQLQYKFEQLQNENLQLESERDELTAREERQDKKLSELQQEKSVLNKRAEEAQHLRDRVDELTHTTDKLAQCEAQLANYKKKLDDAAGLREQINQLEERIAEYVRDNAELKGKLEQQGTQSKLRKEYYDEKINELQKRIEKLKKFEEQATIELQEATEKCDKTEFENKKLNEEVLQLRDINAQLSTRKASAGVSLDNALGQALSAVDRREKIIQLQTENESLRKRAEAAEKDLFLKENELKAGRKNSIKQRKEENEESDQVYKQTIEEMQSKIDQQNDILKEREKEISLQKEEHNKEIEALQTAHNELATREKEIKTLQDQLLNHKNDMQRVEDKYKKYLDKAKQLAPRNASGTPEIQALQNQIQDKERRVKDLERQIENLKTIHEREMKLVTTAWYELGIEVHKRSMADRLSSGGGDSFLAKQRQTFKR